MGALHQLRAALPVSVAEASRTVYHAFRNRPFEPYLKHKSVEGLEFDLWICDRDGRQWYDTTCTDPVWPEMRFLRDRLLRPGDVVLECGAHHACTTVMIAMWVGRCGRVIAFEASPHNWPIIQRNLAHNRIPNVALERQAVGAKTGRVTINNASNSSVGGYAGVEVPMTCLDAYLHLKPTLLKIDVEGYECEVLKGARAVLATRPKLAIEIHDPEQIARYGGSVDELFRLIGEGYDFWMQWAEAAAPVPFEAGTPVRHRCHLFALPRR